MDHHIPVIDEVVREILKKMGKLYEHLLKTLSLEQGQDQDQDPKRTLCYTFFPQFHLHPSSPPTFTPSVFSPSTLYSLSAFFPSTPSQPSPPPPPLSLLTLHPLSAFSPPPFTPSQPSHPSPPLSLLPLHPLLAFSPSTLHPLSAFSPSTPS
ncbi:unnamed protein product [Gadus morhua 'NCC']